MYLGNLGRDTTQDQREADQTNLGNTDILDVNVPPYPEPEVSIRGHKTNRSKFSARVDQDFQSSEGT